MFVSASTECLPDLSLEAAIELLEDLEFTSIEVDFHENGGHIRPTALLEDPERVMHQVRFSHRLDLSAFSIQIAATGEEYYSQFKEICRFAKACKVVTLVVPSSELGTPFNEEVEHLQRLVDLAEAEGTRVAVKCQLGCLSEDPDTLMVLCDNVHGLGITLDPSVFIAGPSRNKSLDKILKYVYHVHLRDTRKDEFQVQVGAGEVEYGRIIQQLQREKYDRALTVHMQPLEGLDHRVELRKLRRLLESML